MTESPAGMTQGPTGLVFVGCYTAGAGGNGAGISVVHRDPVSGTLMGAGLAATASAPSFVVRHPERPVLYAVAELEEGAVTAYDLGPDGELTPRGTWPTGGGFPCHLTVVTRSRGPAWLAVANYGSGSVTALSLDEQGVPTGQRDVVVHTGHGPNRERQDAPHAHMVVGADEGVLAVDLGIDRILYHPFDPDAGQFGATIELAVLPPGAGPRHLVTDKAGRIHVVGELDGMVSTFDTGPTPWRLVGQTRTSTAPTTQPSEIDISPDGRFLYVGNRGPDTIAVFGIDDDRLDLFAEVSGGGAWPRHFAVSGQHLYVANERSDRVAVFALDPDTGVPLPTGDDLSTPSPTCVLPLAPAGL
jgi:6-phosphogluconolactonase